MSSTERWLSFAIDTRKGEHVQSRVASRDTVNNEIRAARNMGLDRWRIIENSDYVLLIGLRSHYIWGFLRMSDVGE